jgi:hypothetical protein
MRLIGLVINHSYVEMLGLEGKGKVEVNIQLIGDGGMATWGGSHAHMHGNQDPFVCPSYLNLPGAWRYENGSQ